MHTTEQLGEKWQALKQSQPKLRIRDAAMTLGVSEMELLCTRLGAGVTRLAGEMTALVRRLPELGEVMALTRNAHAVHERRGRYNLLEGEGHMGQVVGEEIDLRLFFDHWHHAFAVEEPRSVQFFDADGAAVHKVYLQDRSNLAALTELVRSTRHAEQVAPAMEAPRAPRPSGQKPLDLIAFRAAWDAMQNTHEFFILLRKFGLSRTRALELAGPERAAPHRAGLVEEMLQSAAAQKVPIMVFVGNPGVLQIHTGPVERIVRTGPWLNVLDERFNLHLETEGVTSAWIVRKPTVDGVVTSLELYDAEGETVALFFGKRKPGQFESPSWRALLGLR